MNYFTDVIKYKYAEFNGRARRQEFWMFYLWVIAFEIAISMLVSFMGDSIIGTMLTGIVSLVSLAILIPTLALSVRRLHDIGKEWYWIFIAIIPFVGWIWYIVLLATDSQPGDNQFGPYPK